MSEIRKVAVIGAGTMGSGIASHVANAGAEVFLLDIPSDRGPRNAHAEAAVTRLLRSRPPAFFHPDNAMRITCGNAQDDLEVVSQVDWIAEAVVEQLEIKEALYKSIETHRRPGTPISSNTSTIPLSLLTRHMPASFKQDFCITHFFNPVRYMRLLEIVAGPMTRHEVIAQLSEFCDTALGKGVVKCKDTPGFLGNRIGVYAIQVAIIQAIEMGLTVEEADAIMGRPVGWPKTGVFRLYDLIGLDLMLDVLKSMRSIVSENDPFYHAAADIPLIRKCVNEGYTGNKGRGGFYRRNKTSNASTLEAIDLQTGNYRPAHKCQSPAVDAAMQGGLRALVEHPDKLGRFAWRVLSATLSYAASLVPEISDEIVPIDEAMKLGFSWGQGPFEMIDQLGVDWFANRLRADGVAIPKILSSGTSMYRGSNGQLQHLTLAETYKDVHRAPGVVRLSDVKRTSDRLLGGQAASLWDVGDGIACFEFHTKANAIVPQTMELLSQAVDVVAKDYRALVIHNDAPHFSVGVNIQLVLDDAKREAWDRIERMLAEFQRTCRKLKYADFPVIGAPCGMSLGGGFEVLLHCDALVAHTNNVSGLVETKVGLIPAGGGCKELLSRWSTSASTPNELAVTVFNLIGPATTSTSPIEAEPFRFLLPRDQSVMNLDRPLATAKSMAIEMSEEYRPPTESCVPAAGSEGLKQIEEMLDSQADVAPHDRVVGHQLASVLCGGDAAVGSMLTEDQLLDLERGAFMSLIKTPETLARIEYTLNTGKPLRN